MSLPPNDSPVNLQAAPISLARVRALFEQAERHAGSAFLRREIAQRMFERLALIKTQPKQVLDAGCGEGADWLGLRGAYPHAQLLAIDGALSMLKKARLGLPTPARFAQWMAQLGLRSQQPALAPDLLCADFGCLPLASGSVDLVWSNLALHWHPEPDQVLIEWARVLRAEGVLMFSCFGPDSFTEFRQALQKAEAPGRLLPFVDLHDYGDMLVQAGYATPVMDMEKIRLTYSTTDQLLEDLRAFGGNPLFTRPQGLTGKRLWSRVLAALEASRNPAGQLNLTIEVVYGHAFRPQARRLAAGESVIRLDLKQK